MSDEQSWVRIQREFDASIDEVWNMWTDPELFKQWYGPNGMSVPTADMDVVVGGIRKICMHDSVPWLIILLFIISSGLLELGSINSALIPTIRPDLIPPNRPDNDIARAKQ